MSVPIGLERRVPPTPPAPSRQPEPQEGSLSLLLTTLTHAASTCGKNVTYVGNQVQNTSCSDANWLDTGDTAWQLTAATFVGLMSLPGLAVLYAGLEPKKWAVNTMFMAFTGFSAVMVV